MLILSPTSFLTRLNHRTLFISNGRLLRQAAVCPTLTTQLTKQTQTPVAEGPFVLRASRSTIPTVLPYYVTPIIAHRLPHIVGGQDNRSPPSRRGAPRRHRTIDHASIVRSAIVRNGLLLQSSQFWLLMLVLANSTITS